MSTESDKKVILSGIIVSGAGQAAYFTGLDWVRQQCAERLHFQPFPGTLNVQLDENCLALLENLRKRPSIDIVSPDPNFCNAKTLPASLQNLSVAIVMPDEAVNIHSPNIIEIIAPVSLKETLSLKDGAPVVVTVLEL
ncbi:MAG: CTP-dependent riboflavin kinase [Deltaproteobacteria bacterium]|nr:CTP-dependent riboflavin kinase [Deltaproteobacteria bacterium]